MKYGLIGEKLSHSFSREIHSLIGDYRYEYTEIDENSLEDFFKKREFSGFNVTFPYKKKVIKYLDALDSQAAGIGTVNAVVLRDGKLKGFNTDATGLSFAADKAGIDFKGKSVLILGSGGTSLTARFVAQQKNAAKIVTVSRSKKDGYITYGDIDYSADIVINTTPTGMYPDFLPFPVDLKKFKNLYGFIDAVYNPIRTKALLTAQSMGIKCIGGLYMLVAQAVESAKVFGTGKNFNISEIYKTVLASKQNIVLIGMPSCGKTVLGEEIAEKTGKKFIDTDRLITEKTGLTPEEIIKTRGEEVFRSLEAEVIDGIKSERGAIIATGGGSVLKQENIENLKSNGKICLIKRDLSALKDEHRPLSSDIEKLYRERKEIYENAADFCVFNDNIEKAAKKVIKEFHS